jgi:hypothetical protein
MPELSPASLAFTRLGAVTPATPAAQRTSTVMVQVTVTKPISGPDFLAMVAAKYHGMSLEQARERLKMDPDLLRCVSGTCVTGVSADDLKKAKGSITFPVQVTVQGLSPEARKTLEKELAGLSPEDRKAVDGETGKRFKSRTGRTPGRGEGDQELWRQLQGGVLQERKPVPPELQPFLDPTRARKLTPEERATLGRIAEKLKDMSPEDLMLYFRRVGAKTEDVGLWEQSIDAFLKERKSEQDVTDRFRGKESNLEELNRLLDQRKNITSPMPPGHGAFNPPTVPSNAEVNAKIADALQRAGFTSLQDFEGAKAAYVGVFRKRAVENTLGALQRSEDTARAELARYDRPEEREKLFAQLAPVRDALKASADAKKGLTPPTMLGRLGYTPEQLEAVQRSIHADQQAEKARQGLQDANPVLKDPTLATEQLRASTPDALVAKLRQTAEARLRDIQLTRANVLGTPDMVFQLQPIMDATRKELGVEPGSSHDQVLQEHRATLEHNKVAVQIALGALGLVGLPLAGAGATLRLVGAGASTAGAVGGVFKAGNDYTNQYAAAHTDFDKALAVSRDEPDGFWLALELASVVPELGALKSAYKAALPAARALKTTGDVAQFNSELAKAARFSDVLRKRQSLLDDAARTEVDYRSAVQDFSRGLRGTMSQASAGAPGADLVPLMVHMGRLAAKKGIQKFEVFLADVKLRKLAKDIDFNALEPGKLKELEEAFKRGNGLKKGYYTRYKNDSLEVGRNAGNQTEKLVLDRQTLDLVKDTGDRAKKVLEPGVTREQAFDALGGNDPTSPFGRWVRMVKQEGIADEKVLTQALRESPGGRLHDTVRDEAKKKFTDAIMNRLTSVDDLRKTDTYASALKAGGNEAQALQAASHSEMLRITEDLHPSDKGSIAEEWYHRTFGKTRGAERQVVVTQEQAKAQCVTLLKNRRLDGMENGTLRELKNVSTSFGPNEKAQAQDLVKLVGKKVMVNGAPQRVQNVVETMLDPRGVRANAKFLHQMLDPRVNRNLQFEIFNSRGQSMMVDFRNRDILADPKRLEAFLEPPR